LLTFRLQGLEADLGMEGNDYNLALCLFFVTYLLVWKLLTSRYILFEVPANLALRKFRPSLFFSAIMLGWGIVPPFLRRSLILDHDSYGYCNQPYWIGYLPRLSWYDGSWLFPRSLLLLDTLVNFMWNRVDSQVPPIGTCLPHCYFLLHGYFRGCFRWLTRLRNRIHEEHRWFQERMALDFHFGYTNITYADLTI
jgi:hypothetical protein